MTELICGRGEGQCGIVLLKHHLNGRKSRLDDHVMLDSAGPDEAELLNGLTQTRRNGAVNVLK